MHRLMADLSAPSEYSDTERTIFDAALQVFAREGRNGARMQGIADAADINKAMLHYYFRDKRTLYENVFAYTVRQFMASFDISLTEAPTFAETLRVFIDGYVDFVRTHDAAMRLMVQENLAGGTLLGEHMREATKTDRTPPSILVNTIEDAVEAGEIRPVDPHHAVLTVISTCLYFFVARPTVQILHPPAERDWDAFVEERKDHLFDLIYRGLAPRD